MTSRRILSVVVEDHPGVLERVTSQVRRRGFNIESLTVGPVTTGRSRMTVTVDAGTAEVDQVAKQVDKLLEVIDVHDITDLPMVSRELVVARITVGAAEREAAVTRLVRLGARVIDAGPASLIVEFTGEPDRVDAFMAAIGNNQLQELARSGPVAMRR